MIKHSVELFFDETTESTLHDLLQGLVHAGLPSPLLEWGVRPHVSLLLGDALAEGTEDALAAFAADHEPLPVVLDVIGTFAGAQRAGLLLPVVTSALLALHAAAHERLGPCFGELDAHYRPGRWVPHCTQTIAVEEHELEATLRLLRSTPLPIEGAFTRIGVHSTTIDPAREGRARVIGADYPFVADLGG